VALLLESGFHHCRSHLHVITIVVRYSRRRCSCAAAAAAAAATAIGSSATTTLRSSLSQHRLLPTLQLR